MQKVKKQIAFLEKQKKEFRQFVNAFVNKDYTHDVICESFSHCLDEINKDLFIGLVREAQKEYGELSQKDKETTG